MLVDANILLYAVDETSPHHRRARTWLEGALNGDQRVGIPWLSYWAFLRIATNPRALHNPLSAEQAWRHVTAWRGAPAAWVPAPTQGHAAILGKLLESRDIRGPHVSDAVLTALCIEHGLAIVSNDSDFARFPDVEWINPLA